MDGLLSSSMLSNELILPDRLVLLYTEGIENVPWTVGYVLTGGGGSHSKESDHLYMTGTPTESIGGLQSYATEYKIDLTQIKTLYVEWVNTGTLSDSNYSVFGAQTDRTVQEGFIAKVMLSNTFSKKVTMLDVSEVIGEYYITVRAMGMGGVTTSTVRAYKIWGEK